ncbi:MAG TPA: hypothetical protein VED63_03500 [Acidimicrobiales bacterium]|nr:hypothetical protein [Acidimicrobiales bacterium]
MTLHPKLHPVIVGMLVAVPGAVALGACSSSSPPISSKPSVVTPTSAATAATTTTTSATTTANFNSCSVVTQAEAASAIGASVTPGVLGNATVEGGLACVFYGPSAPTPTMPNVAQPDTVRVVVVKGPDAITWYNDYKSKVPAQPVTGYGDEAYYDGSASLSILTGDTYVRIAVAPAGGPPSLSDEEQLAAAILPKL